MILSCERLQICIYFDQQLRFVILWQLSHEGQKFRTSEEMVIFGYMKEKLKKQLKLQKVVNNFHY